MDETDEKPAPEVPSDVVPEAGKTSEDAGTEAPPSLPPLTSVPAATEGRVSRSERPAGRGEERAIAEMVSPPPVSPDESPSEPEPPSEAPPEPEPPPRPNPSLAARLREPEETPIEVPEAKLRARSRRDFLLFGAGVLAAAGGFWWLMPDGTRSKHLTPRLRDWLDSAEARLGATRERREKFLNRALTFDDDVAEALYSPDRSVRTYSKSRIEPLRNNYNGRTPSPAYIPSWTLTVSGLASGRVERLTLSDLQERFAHHDQVTRLCCVEGWSMISWWGGLRFADLLRAYPPMPGARWALLDSAVNLDWRGNSDPYYVSIDLPTARHPQTLLATHVSGRPLPVQHGAPLRLLAPMKLGLKNIKAITSIVYSVEAPADYWNERGYSKYDGL